jgi:hypothetical protein
VTAEELVRRGTLSDDAPICRTGNPAGQPGAKLAPGLPRPASSAAAHLSARLTVCCVPVGLCQVGISR